MKKNSDIVNEQEIFAESKKYLRIGGKWFKKAKDPQTKQETLYDIVPSMLINDFGKEIGGEILNNAPKYLAMTNIPSHIDYEESIDNGEGELFYNIYRPLSHTPAEGEWKNIENLIHHIFQDQYEMGLDYLQILYLNPLQPLPILLLVSEETGTGKSTFCKFINAMFCENALPLTPEIVESRFNNYWVGKLLGYIEEQADDTKDRKKQNAKVKNIVTAETLPSESKGKDPKLAFNFLKIIICSNDEFTPVKIDSNDTRYWVRKVPALTKKEESKDILDECKKEIPAFLYFLQNRKLRHDRQNRLWFSPQEFQGDAWKKIVNNTKSPLEQELREILLDIMREETLDTLRYDLTSLCELCERLKLPHRLKCSITRNDIRQILHSWDLEASRKASRFTYYLRDSLTGKLYSFPRIGKAYKITKKKISEKDM